MDEYRKADGQGNRLCLEYRCKCRQEMLMDLLDLNDDFLTIWDRWEEKCI